jgi:hypothetical protein
MTETNARRVFIGRDREAPQCGNGQTTASTEFSHHMSIDSKGNLYATEVNDNFAADECCRRIQKFVSKGMSSTPAN